MPISTNMLSMYEGFCRKSHFSVVKYTLVYHSTAVRVIQYADILVRSDGFHYSLGIAIQLDLGKW